jgi:outer membrane protein OmpU
MATCSAELVWQTVAFLHQIEAALVGRAWQSLQNTPETRQEGFIRRADYRCGYLSFNFEEKKMKNVLLATTAIALTAGYAAADVSYSASAKLAYGNFGTGTAATASYGYANETDFTVTGSGEASGIAYSASMTIDEDAASNAQGAFSMSASGFTYTYDANDFGGLVDTGADGEDDDAGDWMLSYAGNGITASYEVDEASPGRYELMVGYAANGLTVGLQASDDDGDNSVQEAAALATAKAAAITALRTATPYADTANPTATELAADAAAAAAVTSGGTTDADAINTFSIGYTMGALTVSYKADDQATQNYDVSAAYTLGSTVITVATDENEQHSVGIATTVGGIGLTARTEQDIKSSHATKGGTGAESEFGLTYTMGALTVAYARDTGQAGLYGDEAETVTTLTYDLGGITLVAKGTDKEETEVSAAFTF